MGVLNEKMCKEFEMERYKLEEKLFLIKKNKESKNVIAINNFYIKNLSLAKSKI